MVQEHSAVTVELVSIRTCSVRTYMAGMKRFKNFIGIVQAILFVNNDCDCRLCNHIPSCVFSLDKTLS